MNRITKSSHKILMPVHKVGVTLDTVAVSEYSIGMALNKIATADNAIKIPLNSIVVSNYTIIRSFNAISASQDTIVVPPDRILISTDGIVAPFDSIPVSINFVERGSSKEAVSRSSKGENSDGSDGDTFHFVGRKIIYTPSKIPFPFKIENRTFKKFAKKKSFLLSLNFFKPWNIEKGLIGVN